MYSVNDIQFKGTKDGFFILIKNNIPYEQVLELLNEKIKSNLAFFTGAKFLNISCDSLNEIQKKEVVNFLRQNYSIDFLEKPIQEDSNSNIQKYVPDNMHESASEDKPTKFIRNTIRSGSSIEYEGNVVIIGDVNPGAQITASGNIVIMGILRGIAHAGSHGDEKAFVSANRLNPIQLRIANLIAISPENDNHNIISSPQIAFINENIIVIENFTAR